MPILKSEGVQFEFTVPVLIIGGGACGLCAALAAQEGGAEVLILERDHKPTGSTSLSTGLVPAAGTSLQRERGIEDTPEQFATDLIAKAKHQNDAAMATFVAGISGAAVEWLMNTHGVKFRLVEGFLYPGHSQMRMHGVPSRTGAELQGMLLQAAQRQKIQVMTDALVRDLYADASGNITGVRVERADGSAENIGCQALVLACNGYGGNPEMVEQYLPEMSKAHFHGHVGNQGEAVKWGLELGAGVADMGGYQGHGALAHPEGLPAMYGLLTEGGFQVNLNGERFSNEVRGYSEQALEVVNQPDRIAWNIYDERCQRTALDFTEYQKLVEMGAVKTANSIAELASVTDLPFEALNRTVQQVTEMAAGKMADPFSRDFTNKPTLHPVFCAIRVTGALFHTQGGLVVDTQARVLRKDGSPLPNLFAGGGAARGLSGPSSWGYLSGNGLLTAITLGRTAGTHAARLVK